MKKKNIACPCTSGAPYRSCCRRFHEGDEPADPSELLRSRFSAFALGKGDYLVRTLHPESSARKVAEKELLRDYSRAKHLYRFRGLIIHEENRGDRRAELLFTTRVFQRGRDRSRVELSRFERTDEGWRYLDGMLWSTAELAPLELKIERLFAHQLVPWSEEWWIEG